jgi:hypothetical protein
MRKLVALMLIVAASAVFSVASSQPALARATHATPTPAPTPIGPEDPAASKIARQQFVAWQVGSLDRTRYTDDLNKLADDDQVSHTAAALRQLGALQSMEWMGYRSAEGVPEGSKTYVYRAHCANGSVLMQFSLAPDGKIAGMIFRDNLTDF